MKSLTLSVLSGNASFTWDDLGNTPIGSSGSAVNIISRPGFCFFDMLLHNLPGGCHEQELSNLNLKMEPAEWFHLLRGKTDIFKPCTFFSPF